MNYKLQSLFLISFFLIVGCSNNAETENKLAEIKMIDSVTAAGTVVDFFKAFDERDTATMKALLLPATIIVHHNGAVTNTSEMMQVINETKNWWPRVRALSDFGYVHEPGLAILSLLNKVSFSLPDNKIVEEPYRETWIFKKTENVWKPIRIHYSKIVVEKHSEEVNPEN